MTNANRFSISSALRGGGTVFKPTTRLVLIGDPGIGKTTFGASPEDVVVVATELSALGTDAPKLPSSGVCSTWADVMAALDALLTEEHRFRWMTLDSLTWAERLCAEHVCKTQFKGDWGPQGYGLYGKGAEATGREMRALQVKCERLQEERHMGIIMLAHTALQPHGNALGPDYKQFGGEMSKQTWALYRAWASQVGHACREVHAFMREDERVAKPRSDNQRLIIFEDGPGHDTKTNAGYEQPAKIPLSWEAYRAGLLRNTYYDALDDVVAMYEVAPDSARAYVDERLGQYLSPGVEVTHETMRTLPPARLKALHTWLSANGSEAA